MKNGLPEHRRLFMFPSINAFRDCSDMAVECDPNGHALRLTPERPDSQASSDSIVDGNGKAEKGPSHRKRSSRLSAG
jgi:hypothetical protein